MATGELYGIIIIVAALVLFRTMRNFYRPMSGTGVRLLMPILFMLPGVYVIMNPKAHAPASEWLMAVVVGVLLSIPLILTTDYEVRSDNQIYAKRNRGLIISFLAVFVIRFALRNYIDGLEPETMSALFVLVAFSYVVPWRVASYLKFRRVRQGMSSFGIKA
ncbi:protein of unknown function DUF1453 [Paenibacillus curdlanolyticus YK9]|uniref:CcdC protein n=1 Tax=Paenibacillus curdlanolyticus YK9 TaxID=717606 RepID=E0IAT7_9BACL|nr:cytochrome c biogenesis protein CcdC [Paenibacillus curdlanolyticus]EFM10491.1 protein of unknown function DUF1453 [Paenibacillus curdlanolyticus YK9]